MVGPLKENILIASPHAIPVNMEESLPKAYIRSLIAGGVVPWYWDLEKKEFYLPAAVLGHIRIPGVPAADLEDYVGLNLFKEDVDSLSESLNRSFQEGILSDAVFRVYVKERESIHWFLFRGNFQFKAGSLRSASGQIINLTWLRKKLRDLPDLSEFYRTITDMIPLPVFYKDANRVYRYHNRAFNKMLNLSPSQINGKTIYDLEPASLAAIFDEADLELLEKTNLKVYESLVRYGDGSFHHIIFHKSPVLSPKGEVDGLAGVMIDVTETRKAVEKSERLVKMKDLALKIHQAILNISDMKTILKILLAEVQEILPKADCGSILLLDDKGNLNLEASFGYILEEKRSFSLRYEDSFLWSTDRSPCEQPVIIPDLKFLYQKENSPPPPATIEGMDIQSAISAPIRTGDRLLGFLSLDSFKQEIFNQDDLEVMRYLQEQLVILLDHQNTFQTILNQSRYDSLTGLVSRQFFDEQLNDAVKRAERNGGSFVVVQLDMDNLKMINDRWGHRAGDEMLTTFSAAVRYTFRSTDLFGRLGGDEFGGIVYDTSLKAVRKKFSSLQTDAPGVDFEDSRFSCAFSYGMAEFRKDGVTGPALMACADRRMYRMKRTRKSHINKPADL